MKFTHMADCHLGGWSDSVLSEINIECFERAILEYQTLGEGNIMVRRIPFCHRA